MNRSIACDADVAVIGLGSMGLAAAYYLARAGQKVLGIEQFSVYNDRASHSGETRLIRKSYFEHPDYVPLLELAYKEWYSLEKEHQKQLFHMTGLTYMGEVSGPVLSGVLKASQLYDIQVERKWTDPFTAKIAKNALYEPEAGYLDVAETFDVLKTQAMNDGLSIEDHTKVLSWEVVNDYIRVETSSGQFLVRKLVIAAGAWTPNLVQKNLNLTVTRQVLAWFDAEDFIGDLSCWSLDHPEGKGIYYGFPKSEKGFKVAHHYPADEVDPENLNREVSEDKIDELKQVLSKVLQTNHLKMREASTCLYTNTKDENFYLDFMPDTAKKVIIAAGFSGHGFKFVPAIGYLIRDLVLDLAPIVPIDFLKINRSI